MKAYLEPLTTMIRVVRDDQQLGDPYTWCATLCRVEQGCAEIMGAMRMPTPEEWHAIREVLKSAGYDRVVVRSGDGTVRKFIFADRPV